MATKWNEFRYNKLTKVLCFILGMLMAAGGVFLTLYSVDKYDGAFASMSDFFAGSFTKTQTFQNNIYYRLNDARSLTGSYASEETILASFEAEKKDRQTQLEKNIAIRIQQCNQTLRDNPWVDDYSYSHESYFVAENGKIVVDEAEIRRQLTLEMEREMVAFRQQQQHEAQSARQNLEKEQALRFAVVNLTTGVTYTNMEGTTDFKAAVNTMPWYSWATQTDSKDSGGYFHNNMANLLWNCLPEEKIELYAGFDEAAAVASKGTGERNSLTQQAKNFHAFKRVRAVIFTALLLMFTICCLCAANLIVTAGRREKGGALHMRRTDRIWNFFHWGAGFGIGLLFPVAMVTAISSLISDSYTRFAIILFALSVIAMLAFWGETVLSIARHTKNRTVLKNTLAYKLWSMFRSGMEHRSMKRNTVWILLAFAVWNVFVAFAGSVLAMSWSNPIEVLIITVPMVLAGGIAAFFVLLKHLNALDEIRTALAQAKQGDLTVPLEPTHMPAGMKTLAEGVLNMRQGMNAAVRKAVAGERMRTELITNVSHDLKTPLTSVINYAELLRRDDITEEERSDYLLTLSQKSEQLGRLVEDLVEASKASSGNVDLNLVEVNLHELALQAMGETGDALSAQGIEVILQPAGEGEAPIVRADSQKTWRIIENLMSNVTKYTMPGTRVYMQLACENGFGGLMVKNISREALNVPAEDLTQRFVRGDQARTSDGSGLGLSIAESLCAVQGGRFELNVDGDLFKAGVFLPLAE